MLSESTIVIVGLIWVGLLFGVAVYGERRAPITGRWAAVVYALSLAVHCTSWTFYGTVSQAAHWGWAVPPTFVGTIILFALGFPFLDKLAALARAQNTTSIADLIASRFGRSSTLAAVITGVAVLGCVPYIALQLKAVAMSFAMLTAASHSADPPTWQDSAFWIAVLMAAFAMLFGTRRATATEHNRGLVLAMGFESLFKLIAMLAVGAFAIYGLYDGPADLAQRAASLPPPQSGGGFLALMLVGSMAMFTLPHQFHIGIVELTDRRHLRTARWLFPLYLLLIAAPTLPLSWAGSLTLAGGAVPSDLYVLGLPLSSGARGLALFTFLGGVSAATGMVIMATLTLSIMIGNHWLAPWIVRGAATDAAGHDLRPWVLAQRRVGIALILLLAYGYSRALGQSDALADLGGLSFSALAQLAPAVIAAVYFPALPARAVLGGLAIGVLLWAYLLLVPATMQAGLLPAWDPASWPTLLRSLAPEHFLGLDHWDRLSRGVLLSLAANTLGMLAFARRRSADGQREQRLISGAALRRVAARFLGPAQLARGFDDAPADARAAAPSLVARVEHELAAVIGATSARLLIDAARGESAAELETVANIVGEASQALRFNQTLLEAALENMSQGISVVDAELRLVAWNEPYARLFEYPTDVLQVGVAIETLVRCNAVRGLLGAGTVDDLVQRRLAHMRAGTPYVAERHFPDGKVVEIRGNPMPGGGFVATFTDVTDFRRAEAELKSANETLEQRVGERTSELEAATLEAERANRAKSRFLAAVGHDLLQPINAAHLFTHALAQQLKHAQYREAVDNIDGALTSTESLLGGLLDISRLDAGGMAPRVAHFAVGDLLQHLASEFGALARDRGIDLHWVSSRAWVDSDPQLLRRVLQNFLSNAIRYTERGRVLLGCRRRGSNLVIEVWDTGPGIAPADQRVIFEEFRRLDSNAGAQGLGLGLAIAERIGRLLQHAIELRSWPEHGTVFSVSVPRVAASNARVNVERRTSGSTARSVVLVVDNDPGALKAMQALLSGWQCEVHAARNVSEAAAVLATCKPDVLLLDYHLDAGSTGLTLRAELGASVAALPCVVITADHSEPVRTAVAAAGCHLLHKPLKPLALKSLMARLLAAKSHVAA